MVRFIILFILFYFLIFKGLINLGKEVGYPLIPPRKKITVLLLGNHSAGKSSFINWWVWL